MSPVCMHVFVNQMYDSKQKYHVNEFWGTTENRSPNHTGTSTYHFDLITQPGSKMNVQVCQISLLVPAQFKLYYQIG